MSRKCPSARSLKHAVIFVGKCVLGLSAFCLFAFLVWPIQFVIGRKCLSRRRNWKDSLMQLFWVEVRLLHGTMLVIICMPQIVGWEHEMLIWPPLVAIFLLLAVSAWSMHRARAVGPGAVPQFLQVVQLESASSEASLTKATPAVDNFMAVDAEDVSQLPTLRWRGDLPQALLEFGRVMKDTMRFRIVQDWMRMNILERSRKGKPRWCSHCHHFKPDRCHHCMSCGVCVLGMVHHIPFMGKFDLTTIWLQSISDFYSETCMSILLGHFSAGCAGSIVD